MSPRPDAAAASVRLCAPIVGLLLLAPALAAAADLDWSWGHPRPQGNPVFGLVFQDDQTGWAVARGGQVLRTDDGAVTWHVVQGLGGVGADLMDIVQLPGGALIAGGDGLHRSTDGGSSWIALNNGLGLIQCYAGLSRKHQGTSVFVGLQDNGTVWRHPEGDWQYLLGGDGGWTQVDPTRSYVIFGEYQGAGNLYGSFDSGNTMQYKGSGINSNDRTAFEPPFVFALNGTSRILYATHRIYLSTNEGGTWMVLTGDLTGGGNAAIRTLARAPSNANVIYAATNDGRILRSDNNGDDWILVTENVPGWPRVTREICVDPADAMTVYLAVAYFGTEQLRRSTDGGVTWTALDQNLPDFPINTVAVDTRGRLPVIYIGTDNGVYRSLNSGASWHKYGAGFPTAAVIDIQIMTDKKRMFVATQGRGVWVIDIDLPADMNGDGIVDLFDIDPFVLALTDPEGYATAYPDLNPILLGDMTGDGVLNNFDIDGFVIALSG